MFVLNVFFTAVIENMAKQLFAKSLKQKILRFKVGVKSSSANICKIDYLGNGYLIVMLF